MVRYGNSIRGDLRFFLLISLILSLFGFVFIYSASSAFALERFGASHYFLKKQLSFFLLGLLGFSFFAFTPFLFWKRYAPLFFYISLILASLTLVPSLSVSIHGSSRWLELYGIKFQPSEVLKFFLFIYVASFLEKLQKGKITFWYSVIPFWGSLLLSFFVLLKQPDFGTAATIIATLMILFFIAGFDWKYLLVTFLLAIPFFSFLIYSKSYRLNRILIFLNPWSDPQGRGFQIIQSLIAIGSGGFWGVGISNSKQKFFYLPMQHTDFVFSIIAEEVGFIGICFVLALYILFCYLGFKIALQLKDLFAFFATLGFVTLISLQIVVNLMVTTGLLPTKGLGLPFISYGGTALVILFCMLGLIANFVQEVNY